MLPSNPQQPPDLKVVDLGTSPGGFSLFDFNVLFEDGKRCFLGKGSFASVFKSINGRDGKVYALKIVA